MFYERFASFEDPTYDNINRINKLNNEISSINLKHLLKLEKIY